MLTPQFVLPLAAKLVIDLFAGGGGASTGIEQAIGRPVDVAINQDAEAIGMHECVADPGEMVPRGNQFLVPDPKHKGRNWRHFIQALRDLGYKVEWRVICNATLGLRSTRTRLYLIARRDGLPIVWPQ